MYQKIALLDKLTRVSLPESGLLYQIKLLTMKTFPANLIDLRYAFRLADVISLIATSDIIPSVNSMANSIVFKNEFAQQQTKIDLTIDHLTNNQANSIFNKQID